jgi:hypothetical protein
VLLIFCQEVEYFRHKLENPHDRFVTVMQDFCTIATYSFTEVEDSLVEMKKKVSPTKHSF